GIGNPVGAPDTDIDQSAAPDVEHPVIGRGDGLDIAQEAQAAEDIDLPSRDLLDTEFVRRDRALVDQDDPIPGPREDSPRQRARQTGTNNGNVRFVHFSLAGRDRLVGAFLGNHLCPLRRLIGHGTATSLPAMPHHRSSMMRSVVEVNEKTGLRSTRSRHIACTESDHETDPLEAPLRAGGTIAWPWSFDGCR
ncbi:hypothetical protein chiPu_0030667, partial [Chiloscyllium punctatum]|nr:hypothetical protein [Chiloscyllium punctatum]